MRNRTSIWGTKPSTAPTPAKIPSEMRPTSQGAAPQPSRMALEPSVSQAPPSTSLAQSVRKVPMAMPPSATDLPMARAYTRNITMAKMGSARMRLVTILSILSETDSCPFPFFL